MSSLSPEQRATIAAQLGDAKPAQDGLLLSLGKSIANRRNHEHDAWEDLYCMNLSSYMGERMAPVLRRFLDAEAKVAELTAEADRLGAWAKARESREDQILALLATVDLVTAPQAWELGMAIISHLDGPSACPTGDERDEGLRALIAKLAARVAEQETYVARYQTAWRMARTRALSTGSAADRYVERARELQQALEDTLAAMLGAQVERNAALTRVTELEAEKDTREGESTLAVDFFQPGCTYVNAEHPQYGWRFRCDAITTHPEDGELTALGWRFFNGDWEPYGYGKDDWEIIRLEKSEPLPAPAAAPHPKLGRFISCSGPSCRAGEWSKRAEPRGWEHSAGAWLCVQCAAARADREDFLRGQAVRAADSLQALGDPSWLVAETIGDSVRLDIRLASKEAWSEWAKRLNYESHRTTHRGNGLLTSHGTWEGVHVAIRCVIARPAKGRDGR
jgi:hypothetical protein